jgi:SRSO17 transposase
MNEQVARNCDGDPPPSGMRPVLNLAPRDVADLVGELAAYHEVFAPLFRRAEQRRWALQYLQGQMLEVDRKSIEPLALALPEGNVQAMQQFISEGAWEDEVILETHQRLVAESLGDARTGVLIIDGCEFPKQGTHSVGVARQRCGVLGKIANCQASVVAGYASRYGYTLVDRRLFLPEKWFSADYDARRTECGVPAARTFQTHPELAAELIGTLHARGALPFSWVTFDEDYGRATALLDTVAGLGLTYLAEVPLNTRVYCHLPQHVAWRAPNGTTTLKWVWPKDPEPQRVDQIATTLPAEEWKRHVVKEGAKGPIVAAFAFRRVHAVRDDKLGPEVWLVLRRSLGEKPEVKAYLSNAAGDTPPTTLVWISGMRWPIEVAIEECKGEVGMDHYEVRGWVGWHHHMTMTLLAHHFLVRLRRMLDEKGGSANRAPDPSSAHRGLAQAQVRSLLRPGVDRADSAPELRGVPVSPQAHLATAR